MQEFVRCHIFPLNGLCRNGFDGMWVLLMVCTVCRRIEDALYVAQILLSFMQSARARCIKVNAQTFDCIFMVQILFLEKFSLEGELIHYV